MIFVTVGTHEQPFDRLVQAIDELVARGVVTEEVIIQTGYSTYEPRHCRWQKLFPYGEMVKMVAEARIVVTHGGPSSFLMPLQIGKVPVVVPRLHRFDEHVNDHQAIFCKEVAARNGNIILVEDVQELERILTEYDRLASNCTATAQSNNAAFNEGFCRIMEELMEGKRK